MNNETRKDYPSDLNQQEWCFLAPYLTLLKEESKQHKYPSKEVFNALRWIVKTGSPWRWLPHDFPPWPVVHQQSRRWIEAGCIEAMVHDLRAILRILQDREYAIPSAMIIDSLTVQSTPESGGHAGYDGHKKRKGSKVHIAIDRQGNLLALQVTAANAQDRDQVASLAADVQAVTGESVEIAYVDQGYTGEVVAAQAAEHGIQLEVV